MKADETPLFRTAYVGCILSCFLSQALTVYTVSRPARHYFSEKFRAESDFTFGSSGCSRRLGEFKLRRRGINIKTTNTEYFIRRTAGPDWVKLFPAQTSEWHSKPSFATRFSRLRQTQRALVYQFYPVAPSEGILREPDKKCPSKSHTSLATLETFVHCFASETGQ